MRKEAHQDNNTTASSAWSPFRDSSPGLRSSFKTNLLLRRHHIWSREVENLGIVMLHAEEILKGEAMIAGPSCPLRLGVLDSPDYWTNDALMSAVRPLNPEELHHLAIGSQQQKNREQGQRLMRTTSSNWIT